MRENIIKLLKNKKKSLTELEISNFLKLNDVSEFEELSKEIKSLINDGLVLLTKKDKIMLLELSSNLKQGTLRVNRYGHGYITSGEDYFIHKNNLKNAISGDIVLIEVNPFINDGRVIRIINRNLSNIVGKIKVINNEYIFIPRDNKLEINISIQKESLKNIVDGHIVLIKIVKELKHNNYIASIEEVMGHENDPGVDILEIAYQYGIREEFNEKTFDEVNNLTLNIENELKERKDLREKIVFTLDGDDTKDIDDAISLEIVNDNYVLGVHIADVAYYVRPGTSLYNDAYLRGNSNYLADTVIPMIPHELSNGICSLNENEDRLSVSTIMTISKSGKVLNYEIADSIIKSRKQMTYNNVNKVLEGEVVEGYQEFSDTLHNMKDLANILRKEKINRGYLDFNISEASIVQDESGKCIGIEKREQKEAERIIEDFMIITNEVVARHLTKLGNTSIYRVHDTPNTEKLEEIIKYLNSRGLKIEINNFSNKGIQEILQKISKLEESDILNDLMLRSMSKARYDINNIGHYGLGSFNYTHFTAPIRRFSDLVVHHLIKNNYKNIFTDEYLILVSELVSEKEEKSIGAERKVLDIKMAEYMQDNIGNVYEGRISSVMEFGFFVKLDNLVEGLVHVTTLRGYFRYVPEYKMLSSDNKSYVLGSKIKVRVVAASKENGTIDFEEVHDDGN